MKKFAFTSIAIVLTVFALFTFVAPVSSQETGQKVAQAASPITTSVRPQGLPADVELPTYTLVPLSAEIQNVPAGVVGVHVGKLNDILNIAFIVEEVISPTKFKGYYAWGTASAWNISVPGSNTVFGEIKKGKLVFSRRNGLETHEYKVGKDGQLKVEVEVRNPDGSLRGGSSANLKRIVGPSP